MKVRLKLGLTETQFAAECGHSQQFQQQIEAPAEHEITADKALQILTAIKTLKKCS